MNFGIAALICWLATAAVGGFLLYLWALRAARAGQRGRPAYGRPPPYIPRWLVVAHVALAVGGLATWWAALFLLDELAYASIVALLAVALLGASMFVRWLGSRRARRAALALNRAPSESRLPTVAVIGHGLLGVTTVVLVLLSWFRPAGL
jgi:hypothetical protein